jgi:biopolymer transport protein ExbD
LDDAFAEVDEVGTYISSEWNLMEGEDKQEMTVCIKADKKTKMKVITDIKSKLREVNALRINYAALEPVKKGN